VRRILTFLMMIMLVVAPSAMVSAAACRHKNPLEHALARANADAKIANVARSEETAASLSKKGTLSNAASGAWLADMLPPPEFAIPFHIAEPVQRSFGNEDALPGTSIRPLLEPPAA
jgi:hypothetical protein